MTARLVLPCPSGRWNSARLAMSLPAQHVIPTHPGVIVAFFVDVARSRRTPNPLSLELQRDAAF